MIINEIELNNFRNYKNQVIKLEKGINVFYGNNAQGKTNLLEAIFLCAIGKSFRTNKDKEFIKFGYDKTDINVSFKKNDRDGKVSLDLGKNKRFFVNDVLQKKTSQILGNIFVVLFTPDDISILKDGPINRRRFLNIMISQLRPTYMHLLSQYNKTLLQRNNYLRQIRTEHKSIEMLDIWDEKLVELAVKIYNYREEFIHKIVDKLCGIHSNITNNSEKISMEYISNVKNCEYYRNQLLKYRENDILRGSTSVGIHRDDFRIMINDKEISSYGSQGQHRTAILSLKIAELEIIYDEVGEYPILLLDDFMSELDDKRRDNLLKNMKNNQVIITCTDKKVFENFDAVFYNVKNGTILKF